MTDIHLSEVQYRTMLKKIEDLQNEVDDARVIFEKHLKDKTVNIDIITKEQALLNKTVDKAAKAKAIHKNKARRIKSKISRQIAAHGQSKETTKQTTKKTTKEVKKTKSKSKSA